MSNKMLITTKLNQSLQMSPQLRQAINILQYSTLELDAYLKELLDENPMLEEAEAAEPTIETSNEQESALSANYTVTQFTQSYDSQTSILDRTPNGSSLQTHLSGQLLNLHLSDAQLLIAEQLIYLIDEDGRLAYSDDEILECLDLDPNQLDSVNTILTKIQNLDPVGVAARSLKECLMIQINELKKSDSSWETVEQFIDKVLDKIGNISKDKLLKLSGLSNDAFVTQMNRIEKLNPFPGKELNDNDESKMLPELYIKNISGKWHVCINDVFLSRFSINNEYSRLIKEHSKDKSYSVLNEKLNEAKLVMSSIKKRNETLLSIGTYIMENQLAFLEDGSKHIKSMNIDTVAKALNIHESTVSRATNGKYIATPHGMYELKKFFPSYIKNTNGSTSSSTCVKSRIKELIENETPDQVLSDRELTDILNNEGYKISRRTIVKYRESMNILSSYDRAKLLSISDRSKVET